MIAIRVKIKILLNRTREYIIESESIRFSSKVTATYFLTSLSHTHLIALKIENNKCGFKFKLFRIVYMSVNNLHI